jgi:hypothetical protein
MGTYKGGALSLVKGKIGNTVSYDTKLGYSVVREIGVRVAPFTTPELANQSGTKLVTEFLRSLVPVIRIGFQNIPPGKKWSAYNHASSVLKLNALKGKYPSKKINYEKVMLSIGKIPAPKAVRVELIENELHFSWDTDLNSKGSLSTDRVMIVAFVPSIMRGLHMISGAKRAEGKEIFPLTELNEGAVVETYISYIGHNQKDVSDSVYVGQFVTTSTQ